ncbi:hypothetical protein pipiens_015845, partial [Culex pipiens pipiens]
PAENRVKLQADGESSSIKMDFDHGTTTLGFRLQGEVILAVDSRATGGQFIGSRTMKKIAKINEYLLGTLAGGWCGRLCVLRLGACQGVLNLKVAQQGTHFGGRDQQVHVQHVYYYKSMFISMGMMLAGYDKRGPQLYYIDSEGTRTPGKVF